ncbi:phosphotransferase family protein [Oceanobacillus bengalensis]|nr:aminoglycoside phosphotransferase family protein [Oceanobacillus bengalensis]
MSLDSRVMNWVINNVDATAKAHSAYRLKGSTSSTLHLVKLVVNQKEKEVVLRQFDNKEWLKQEPDLVIHEAESLRIGTRVSIPTPEIIAYDETGIVNGIPMVLMSKVEGKVKLDITDRQAWLKGLADALVRVHEVDDVENLPWRYFPYNQQVGGHIPSWTKVPEVWDKAVSIIKRPFPAYKKCFIHRDYHPTNVLWQGNRVSGIVDWVNACLGPRGVDVGHCRVNLAMLYGVDVADEFLKAYTNAAGVSFVYNPYWDFISLNDILDNDRPSVYPGWVVFGVKGLTEDLMVERLDKYISSLLEKM